MIAGRPPHRAYRDPCAAVSPRHLRMFGQPTGRLRRPGRASIRVSASDRLEAVTVQTPHGANVAIMARSQWHRFYETSSAAPAELLFRLLSDLPNYGDWLPGSEAFGRTTDVEPYPVRRGTRYHDGKPDEPGNDWWGTVTGYQPSGSVDFHHTIHVKQLRATVDVHIHYSLEAENGGTVVTRWLILDVTMPVVFRPLRSLATARFDKENVRTMAALKQYAEAQSSIG